MTVLKLVLNDKMVIHDPFGSDIKSRKADNLLIISLSLLFSCGGLTRTDDLWVMSPTSYQLLHSAMFLFCECKGTAFIWTTKYFDIYFSIKMLFLCYVAGNQRWPVLLFFIVLSGTIVNNLFIFLCGRKKRITFAQIIQQCAINLWPYQKQKPS